MGSEMCIRDREKEKGEEEGEDKKSGGCEVEKKKLVERKRRRLGV